ncbi:hypothetical protein [Gordonia sp. 852002-50395_SCH5434458]|uniref:hypothetical protein n=1 Tax=Gordonia sp. 852002-50395_SCH5434458 TaxID=1834090 RepID=UPI0007E93889|nr:hypothetical protein [Gordonia sp. 852002-50395_SCH5434458]OBC02701.1 hypothetical protein A5785_02495 [Gordonia sp. 852002-50395_SCH5434458]
MAPIDDLERLVAPPPDGGPAVDWDQTERALGFRLPDDYKRIVQTYGPGAFVSEVSVWVPSDAGGDVFEHGRLASEELAGSVEWIEDNDWEWIKPGGETEPVNLGPQPLQFSPWGGGASGSFGYWHQTGDDPNSWPVLYTDLSSEWLYHDGGLAAFIVDFLNGAFGGDLMDTPGENLYFERPIP